MMDNYIILRLDNKEKPENPNRVGKINKKYMKALSIIGIVLSFFGVIFGIGMMGLKLVDEADGQQMGAGIGFWMVFLNLFFLAYSIVGTVVSFSKKKVVEKV